MRESTKTIVMWAAAAVVAAWIAMLLHEGAHYLLAVLVYPRPWSEGVPRISRGIVAASGPASTMLLLGLVAWKADAARLLSEKLSRPAVFVLVVSLGLAAASRAIVMAPLMSRGRFGGDETAIASGLNLPVFIFGVPEFLISVAGAIWLYSRIPTSQRLPAIAGSTAALIAGWITIIWIGPRLGLPI